MLQRTSVTRCLDCFFNIWPFTTMKIYPKAYKKSQNGFTTLPNIKSTFQMLLKISKFWLNFVKSGHTAEDGRGRHDELRKDEIV